MFDSLFEGIHKATSEHVYISTSIHFSIKSLPYPLEQDDNLKLCPKLRPRHKRPHSFVCRVKALWALRGHSLPRKHVYRLPVTGHTKETMPRGTVLQTLCTFSNNMCHPNGSETQCHRPCAYSCNVSRKWRAEMVIKTMSHALVVVTCVYIYSISYYHL